MRKISKAAQAAFKELVGGTLPKAVVQRRFAIVERKRTRALDQQVKVRRQAAKYLRQANPSKKPVPPAALSGLQAITDKIAKHKPPPSRRFPLPGQIALGSYTLRFTPPYTGLGTSLEGQISGVTGHPTLSASGVDNLGQLSCSAYADYDEPSTGTASNLMGVYFRPLFEQATVTISFESQIFFSWYVNSIQGKSGISSAQGLIELYEYDGAFTEPPLRRGAFVGSSVEETDNLDFNVINEAGPTWTLTTTVSSAKFYFIVIRLSASELAAGWPGSLAGTNVVVTVPSITVTVTSIPVVAL